MDADCFIQNNKKVQIDTTKQLCYEFSLKSLILGSDLVSQFVIPWHYAEPNKLKDIIGDEMNEAILHPRIRDNNIEVFKANFSQIQSIYLSHD